MATTHDIAPGQRIDLTRQVVGIDGTDRRARVIEQPGGPPQRINGISIGAPHIDGDPPHDGEMHPDGDELLYLISGTATLTLELPDGLQVVELSGGDAVVVPMGVWHQLTTRGPAQLLHITPGPNGDARPLGGSARG
jgi:mannose-6-phosphate isomerase-like protein (cupin superfamily)